MKKKHSCGCKSKKRKKPVKKPTKKPRIKKLLVLTPRKLTVGRTRKKKK